MPRITAFLRKHAALLVLLAAALIIRIFIYRGLVPRIHTDSVTYLVLPDNEPIRTPGYYLFIEAVQFFNDFFSITPRYLRLIIFCQMFFLGLINTFLIYSFARFITSSRGFALAVGLIFNFDYFVTGFEFLILTETLTLTLLGLALFFYWKIFQGMRTAAFWAGLFSVWLLLTRPTFAAFFALLIGTTLLVKLKSAIKRGALKRYAKPLAVYALINVVALGGWSLRNKIKFDYFGISTILPYQLGYYTQHFYGRYVKGSSPELDKYADIFIEERGRPYDISWRLAEDLKMSKAEISRVLLKINLKLIRENFGDYARLVPKAAADYYDYSWYWTLPHNKGLMRRNKVLAVVYNAFFGLFEKIFKNLMALVGFVALVPVALILANRKREDLFHLLWLLEATIHYSFLISVLLTHGGVNNLRFRVPLEPFILLVFSAALFIFGRDVWQRLWRLRRRGLTTQGAYSISAKK